MRKYAADSVNDVGRDFLPLFGLAFPSHLILLPSPPSGGDRESRSPTAPPPPPPKKTQSQPPTPEIPTAIKFWPKTSGDIDTARISWTESPTKTTTSERSTRTSTSTEKLVYMNISMQAAEGNFNRVGLRLNVNIRGAI